MLTNSETGCPRCETCGDDITGPTSIDEHGGVTCRSCEKRDQGYGQGTVDSNRAFVESALVTALQNGTTAAELEDWLADVVDGKLYFVRSA